MVETKEYASFQTIYLNVWLNDEPVYCTVKIILLWNKMNFGHYCLYLKQLQLDIHQPAIEHLLDQDLIRKMIQSIHFY